ncbi:Ig-like domain-containing protein, partial [Candidatus Uhrbacteria bacterium]|nr:Ig-like domain-containing protein [Candidatus Uhrbacteria bacterium]
MMLATKLQKIWTANKQFCINFKIKAPSLLLIGGFVLFLWAAVWAQGVPQAQAQVTNTNIQSNIKSFSTIPGLSSSDPRAVAARLIKAALGLLGIIAVVLVLYAGFLYMTAAGESEKVSTAKKILTNGLIGLLIIASAYGLVTFVFNKLFGLDSGQVASVGPPTGDGGGLNGGLGGGIIDSHYPARNATDIPRNTKIVVTFKEKMETGSLINAAGGTLNASNVKIRETSADPTAGPFVTNVLAVTKDQKTFVFSPQQLLGSATQSVSYTVFLANGIKKA